MEKRPEKSFSEDVNKQKNAENQSVIMKINRRDFLRAAVAIGGAAVIGSSAKVLAKDFEGWPDRYGCLTDLTLCVGCRSCEEACNKVNNLPGQETSFDDKSVFEVKRRPTVYAYTVVNQYKNPKDPVKPIYRKIQCNHCDEPGCASACPIHAYTKTKEGAVLYDPEKCFGCRYCMVACPFYVPAYDYESAFQPKIVKCLFCYDRIKAGGMPACAEACPAGTITFGKRNDLIKLAREKIRKNPDKYLDHIYGEHEAGGTSWIYISGVAFEQLDFPTNIPKRPLIEETKGFLNAVPVVLTVWPALFGMIYSAQRHSESMENNKVENQEREWEKK